ncbi:hypothetical protein KP509_07G046900 [Ceratopteris richardii]|nr:hypothetical protein KP509_07G046900 [Ceratopteris richardii]
MWSVSGGSCVAPTMMLSRSTPFTCGMPVHVHGLHLATMLPHQLAPTTLSLQLPRRILRRSRGTWDQGRTLVRAKIGGGGEVVDRLLSAVSYVLPLLDGMQYGRYIFAQYPASERLFRPLFPILRMYSSMPLSNFILFFTLYLAVVRNPKFGRYVRFNAMQACILDVLIVVPIIVQRILSPRSGLGLDLLIVFYNSVFIALLGAIVFAVISCLLGRIARIPLVADAVDNQLY